MLGTFNLKEHPLISLNIVSIEDSGKIIYLNNDVRYYDKLHDGKNYKYHFIGDEQSKMSEITDTDLDSYRNVLSSGYNVFKSKTSGKLAILAELVMIDSYSVSHSIHQIPNSNPDLGDQFEINLHIDVSPSIDEKNINPVLKYHYLKNSQGYLQAYSDSNESVKNKLLFTDINDDKINGTSFSDVYMLTRASDQSLLQNESFSQDNFNFPKSDQYISAINDNKYSDLKLGQLNFPKIISDYSWNLPFKYDYTLVPCMEYGRLEHLAVSNTIDFSNMRDFNKSNFNTWKYRIDGNQLRITFSTDIYDTFEEDKVDALVLEFYDHRGFAGSLEISGKKSYSGQFTKILYLNTINALSKNKINEERNNYITDFKRNINIVKQPDGYFLNDENIGDVDYEKGWNIGEENNDCGIIYPNVVYGIKTYLRRTKNDGFEFIPKKEFILYTLPIYNEYYYKISNFNALEYPELDFVLTYKLEEDQNKSKIKTVNNGSFMKNGYPNVDTLAKHYDKINKYLSNTFDENELSVVRYYQYEGQSKLNIEVGLHQNYSECGLSYDSEINKKFNCKLKLLSNDENKVYTVSHNKSNEIITDILNEKHEDFNYKFDTSDYSYIKFENNNTEYSTNGGIYDYNFLNHNGNNFIPINYKFMVGYKINITDIKPQNIPATTICALCHKKDDNTYNYEDFGIYESINDDTTLYLSKAMFFNEGTHEIETFGVCQQIQLGGSVLEQCTLVDSISTEATRIATPGKLNSGNPLKEMSKHIGKLTFCQPHVHGFSEVNGTNIQEGKDNSENLCYEEVAYCLPPALGEWTVKDAKDSEDAFGTAARNLMQRAPLYNLSLNTKNAIQYNSEFISTIRYKEIVEHNSDQYRMFGINFNRTEKGGDKNFKTDWQNVDPHLYSDEPQWRMRQFTGFKGNQVAKFNRLLLNTMKNVYAYNPDYDSISYNIGDIKLQDYIPQFNSNIVSVNAKFDNDNINEYILLPAGNYYVKFSEYVEDLFKYISKDNKNKLTFKPNLDFCGESEEKQYLITSLTYNTPVPEEHINKELDLKNNEFVIIRHHDNKNSNIFSEIPNKNLLYGWKSDKGSLLQLDVSNYKIGWGGDIQLTDDSIEPNSIKYVSRNDDYSENFGTSYDITKKYINEGASNYQSVALQGTSITLNDLLYEPNKEGHRLFFRNNKCLFYNSEENRGKIYYRTLDLQTDYGYLSNDNQYKNCLCLYTGPCFTGLGFDNADPEKYDYPTVLESSSVAASLEPEDENISTETSAPDLENLENSEVIENN